MEKITKTTNYWLFKQTTTDSKYFFVRAVTEGLDNVTWFMGYKNHLGLVSSIGGDLKEETIESLEKEFQNSLK